MCVLHAVSKHHLLQHITALEKLRLGIDFLFGQSRGHRVTI